MSEIDELPPEVVTRLNTFFVAKTRKSGAFRITLDLVQRARQRLAEYRQTIEHELARARNRGLALIAAPHPVVGRHRTIATWRLSFHCGMNAADASAWQGWPGPRRQTALVRQRGEGPDSACAVTRRRFPAGASPARRSLQPEATGAGMEETKCLKPPDSGHEFGDRASVQAATRETPTRDQG